MTTNLGIRRALLVILGVLLLWLAWTGIMGGVNQLPESHTTGQIAQSLTQFSFGLFALLSLVTTFWGRRWNRLMLAGWIVSVTLAAGLAAVIWGGASLLVGLASGAGALLIGLGIAWVLRFAGRHPSSA